LKVIFIGFGVSCVHEKYQLSGFNIAGAIKERDQKSAIINKNFATIFQLLDMNSKIWLVTFLGSNMRSLDTKLQPSSF